MRNCGLSASIIHPETSDPRDQDGPEGPSPLHPTAHVLGFVRSAGRWRPITSDSFMVVFLNNHVSCQTI